MKCRNCDGQGKVIWQDGVALPAYYWNAEEDKEICKSCGGTGEKTKGQTKAKTQA